MKRILSLFAATLIMGFATYAKGPVAKGKTYSSLGNYIVEVASTPVVFNGVELKTYVISYENSDMKVKVGVDDSKKRCTSYLVVSDELTIQYDCNGDYFGVKKAEKKYRKEGFSSSDLALNKSEYYHQKVLTRTQLTDIEHVQLISVYFPKLVTNYENVFAVK